MYVLCDECHTHYDDESRRPNCEGPGRTGNHREFAQRPIEEHLANVKGRKS